MPGSDAAAIVLDVVRGLLAELRPGDSGQHRVALDSRLGKDLGLDSLARVELVGRVESAFGVSLAERVLAAAETPRDLLEAALAAGPAPLHRTRALEPAEPGEAELPPDAADTLVAVLDWHVRAHPDRPHARLHDEHGEGEVLTYAGLRKGADRIAGGLLERGLEPGGTVGIMLPTGRDYLETFFGALIAGGVPVPIYPPARPSQIEEHLRRHARILENAGARILVTVPEAKPLAWLLKSHVEGMRSVATVTELAAGSANPPLPRAKPGDVAFLQYTSGSTGSPKGVILTHANLLANIRTMGQAARVRPTDVLVSWLPLYHDMGLIGAWLGSLYHGMPLVLMSPLAFLSRPARWLRALDRYRGTMTAAPNFAFELCLRKIAEAEVEGLDLSSVRLIFNGAEPVSSDTLRRFIARFSRHGLRPEALAPVYGLAECSVGLTFPPLGRPPRSDRVRRGALAREGRALEASPQESDAVEFVSCGIPLPGHQVRVVDGTRRELGERSQGRLQFKGPSATSGYFRNPEATRRLREGDWLESGDLAYVADGEVFVTGRVKDVIIRAGRNLYPQELEEAVGNLPGVRRGCVAVFGSSDPRSGTERLVVLAETRLEVASELERLRGRIQEIATDLTGDPPDEVVLAPPHTVLKTSSGKIRRAACRELYERGRVGAPARAVWMQYARLALGALPSRWRLVRRAAGELASAGLLWTVFVLLAPGLFLATACAPGPRFRWAVNRRAARLLVRLLADPLVVRGLDRLDGAWPSVLVANHASYLDAMVLAAVLPRPVRFVAKQEFRQTFVLRVYFERLGVVFVERADAERGVEDLARLAGILREGGRLAFFPEGTFDRMSGLLAFRMGAFVAAAEAGTPVVPVAIRGTRSMLRSETWLPRRGPVEVTVGSPIHPEGTGWQAAVKLRDAAREEILRHCGEPDLGDHPPAGWLLEPSGERADESPASV